MQWPVTGGIAAVFLEYLYRRGLTWGWPSILVALPLAMLVSYSISRTLQASPTMLSGLVLFSVVTAVLRVGVAFTLLNDPLRPSSLVAAGALLIAAGVNLVWR